MITVIESAHHKLTCGEIVKAIKQLQPDSNSSSIRRILTRLTRNINYSIARTETRPYLYYYSKIEPKEQIPYELDSFFDSNEPLFIHRIIIMLRNLPIKKDEKLTLPFLHLSNPIRFNFYKNTQSIRIDLKCSGGWKKALDIYLFNALIAAVETVLHLKEISCSRDKMRIINFDLHNDKDFLRIAGANYVSVQAFQNLLLTAYNKKEGLRKEVQLSNMDIPVDRMIKQLQRTSGELKIGTVFNRTNILLSATELALNKLESRSAGFYTYASNVVQEFDGQLYNFQATVSDFKNNQMQSVLLQENMIHNQGRIVKQIAVTNDMLLDHDNNMKKECDFLAEEIQILKVISTNQARSESLQTRILDLLKEKDYTLQDLVAAVKLNYNRIYYHIRKLLDLGKITAYKEERKGKGARKQIFRLHTGE